MYSLLKKTHADPVSPSPQENTIELNKLTNTFFKKQCQLCCNIELVNQTLRVEDSIFAEW